ncbi:hypothetical protein HU200_047927 [Digitaria exilis]|uniref:WIYLD domain-containing protein n=1 Tax=Digitaria exilis TaxID=1010633 RepID=A0A835AWI0_9POAL|nr:hypothetical protein HU200_047927 [Digitaria exilis]
MGRPKLKSGERRIDAAIDHLAPYGFPKPQIRKVINDLLKLYGRDGWAFLEDGSYRVVLEKLLEEQTQLEVNSLPFPTRPPVSLFFLVQYYTTVWYTLLSHCSTDPLIHKKQEAAAVEEASPENDMEVSRVHSDAPTESWSALESQASPNSSLPQEHVLPVPPATGAARTRRPCYGWISEESETESESEDGEMISNAVRLAIIMEKDIPKPAETLPSNRKRPTRWDVRPNW